MSDGNFPEGTFQSETAVERIAESLRGLAYGSVEVTVHEGRIVQIERREKVRVEIPVGDGERHSDDGK